MLRQVLTALMLGHVLPTGLSAEPDSFDASVPDLGVVIRFHVPRADRRYGILVQAPKTMPCLMVRYRIEGAGSLRVSIGLTGGELALVALRGPWPPGPAELTVTPLGCAAKPGLARRVLLDRASPDHGWRGGGLGLTKDPVKPDAVLINRPPGTACGTDGLAGATASPALALRQMPMVPCD